MGIEKNLQEFLERLDSRRMAKNLFVSTRYVSKFLSTIPYRFLLNSDPASFKILVAASSKILSLVSYRLTASFSSICLCSFSQFPSISHRSKLSFSLSLFSLSILSFIYQRICFRFCRFNQIWFLGPHRLTFSPFYEL